MPTYATIGGVQREFSAVSVMIGGVQRELDYMYAAIDGVQREIFSSGYKWERYNVAYKVEIEDATGIIPIAVNDTCYKSRGTLGDTVLSVYDSDPTLIYVAGIGYTTRTRTTTIANFAGYVGSSVWVTHNGTVVSGKYTTVAEKAYYVDGTYDSVGIGYTRIAYTKQSIGDYVDTVKDTNVSAYPVNGIHTDGYWYVMI